MKKFFHFFLVLAFSISAVYAESENIIFKIDVASAVSKGDAALSSTEWDIGHVNNCFDGDTTSVMRTPNISPAFVQITFQEFIVVGKSRVFLEYQNDWWLEAAETQEDLDSKSGTYQLLVPRRSAVQQIWDEFIIPAPVKAKIWKFNIDRTVGEGYVHIGELELWSDIRIDTLEVTPDLFLFLPYETGKIICCGHTDALEYDYNINNSVTWHSDNKNVASVSDNGTLHGRNPGTANIWAEFKSLQSNIAAVTVVKENVALLIDSSIYQQLEQYLNIYEQHVEYLFPVNLFIHADKDFNSLTPLQIRSCIQDLYYNQNIDGIILAGSIPYALWQNREQENKGINSFYYEDLDGQFTDTNSDGYDDIHQWGENIGPEVWTCWMRPPASNQIEGLKNFLEKTHDYYTGHISFNYRAFAVAHSDYDVTLYESFCTVYRLSEIYGNSNVDVDGAGTDLAMAQDYLTALENNRYEILDPSSHAWSEGQALEAEEGIVSTQIRDLSGGAIMTFLYGCHTGAFNESPDLNIAMMYVMGNSIGQVASGTSWSYGNGERYFIYDVLKDGGYVGRGWMNLLSSKYNPVYTKLCYGESVDISRHLWGDNLIGNPFVSANFNNFVPVELSSFTATLVHNDVHLAWVTLTQANNFGFVIERHLQDSLVWNTIGFVPGNGTTTEVKNYSFLDKNVSTGKYSYRLKQIDYDGSIEYSKIAIVEVKTPSNFKMYQNYPNPYNPVTKISWQSPVGSWQILKVFDVLGNEIATLVDEEKEAGYHSIDFNGSDLPSGVYFYRIQAGNYIDTKKMLLLK